MREIERTLRKGASAPHTGGNKEEIKGYMLDIQQILGTLHMLNPSLSGDPNFHAPNITSFNLHEAATIPASQSGILPSPHRQPYVKR